MRRTLVKALGLVAIGGFLAFSTPSARADGHQRGNSAHQRGHDHRFRKFGGGNGHGFFGNGNRDGSNHRNGFGRNFGGNGSFGGGFNRFWGGNGGFGGGNQGRSR